MTWHDQIKLFDELVEAKLNGELIAIKSTPPFNVTYRVGAGGDRFVVTSLDEMLELREQMYTPPEEDRKIEFPNFTLYNRGTDGWERKVMQERYKKRNDRLDKLPPEQKEQMGRFMNKLGVNKTAPSSFTAPIKEKRQDD